MALTKAEMAEKLFEEVGLNKREAKDLVEAFFEEIRGALENNQQVKLSGFGNFDLRDKNQRPGRNAAGLRFYSGRFLRPCRGVASRRSTMQRTGLSENCSQVSFSRHRRPIRSNCRTCR